MKQRMVEVLKIRHESPEKEMKLCQELYEDARDAYTKAFAATYLADAYHSLGWLRDAADECRMAKNLTEANKFDQLSLFLYNLAGVIYIEMDDEQSALDYFYKDIELAQKMSDYKMYGAALANIAYVYRRAGAYDKAESTLEKAYYISNKATKNDEKRVFNENFYNIQKAKIALKKKEYDRAFEFLGYVDRSENDVRNADTSMLYADYYAQTGNHKEAEEWLRCAVDVIEAISNKFEKLSDYFQIIEILIKLEAYTEAEKLTEETEKMLADMHVAGKWVKLAEYEIAIYQKLGDSEKLERAYEMFCEYDIDFNAARKRAGLKRIKKRIELQKEMDKRADIEAKQAVLENRSEYDELTGVFNRRGLRKYTDMAFARAQKDGQSFAVLIVDVDFFKEFNDTYGHVAGDACLKKIAEILKNNMPDKGIVGRYGGDEFFIAISGQSAENMNSLIIDIRKDLEDSAISNGDSKVVTVTIGGVNTIPRMETDILEYVHAADHVLYRIKKSTRNGFEVLETL